MASKKLQSERLRMLESSLPAREKTIAGLHDYMQRTQLTIPDLAPRIGYGVSTLSTFHAGQYQRVSGNDTYIRKAIEDYIKAHPVTAGFGHASARLHETANVAQIRRYFYAALDNGHAYYFRGAPGTQKSFVLEALIAELNRVDLSKNGHGRRAFYVYCRQNIRPGDLMKRIAEAAGTISAGNIDRILRNLRHDLGGRKVLICLDEAQHLSVDCIETVRELLDRLGFGLLFAGSHDIESTFNRYDMEQWHSRLRQGAELPGISDEEAARIARAEIPGIKDAAVKRLVDLCYTRDLKKGKEVRYISARELFFSLEGIRAGQAAKTKEEK
jgi:DNA transposition AAA+ family ATPase